MPLPIRMKRADGTESLEYAVNLSVGGLCLQLREPLALDETVELAFDLPPRGPRVETRARVIWVTREEDRGSSTRFCEMGLRFEALGPEPQDRIQHYVRRSRSQGADGLDSGGAA